MKLFTPKNVFYEPNARKYPQGNELLDKYKSMGIPCFEIQSHHKIDEHRSMPDDAFVDMKKYLILGERKTQKFVPNQKTSDFLVPYTSSGCPAICTYCYLVCTFFKCSYLRIFLNRQKLLDKVIKTSKEQPNKIFEIGSNSDLIIENTITSNLIWTIENFAVMGDGKLTLPTKFDMVDCLLNLDHRKKTIIRMSVNPEFIVNHVEIGTSNLESRIVALNKLYYAGYPVGLIIAPVILIENYQIHYEELLQTLKRKLCDGVKKKLNVEIIMMTYGHAQNTINTNSLKTVYNVYDEQKMTGGYRGKYRYKKEIIEDARLFIIDMVNKYLPECNIVYFC